jgi:hypothetical protein
MLWVLCENALFECDLHLRRTRVITGDDLKRNAPKCFAAIFPSLIAIGCSDGAIRVWDTYNWVLASTLHSHTRDVLALKVVGVKADGRGGVGGGEDSSRAAHAHRTSDGVLEGKLRLVSIGLDGAGYLWESTIVGECGDQGLACRSVLMNDRSMFVQATSSKTPSRQRVWQPRSEAPSSICTTTAARTH